VRLSQQTIDEIKNHIDIVDVIGDFIQMKRVGHSFKALSPFSDEKTPSFIVFPKNENFKDFSSGKQGDAITFIMEYDGLSYIDALLYLAKKYGIEVKEEDQTEEEIQQQNERESLFIVLNFARDFFVDKLWNDDIGRSIGLSYLQERGFPDEIIKSFELGYSLDQWSTLHDEGIKKGFSEDLLEKAGLIIKKEDRYYDRFRGRVIFPVHNSTGKAIAFGARMLGEAKNQPKYINSPETDVYHKSDILYGIHQARQAIRGEDNCYLVEGYTDVISLHVCGVKNVVASSGTSLTENQIRLIKRHTENITVLFDGDPAGIKASLRGIDMILEQGMNVKAVVFPDKEDPDSYSRKLGTMGFREFLKDNVQDFLHFKTQILLKGHGHDPIQKAETINKVIASIALIPDPVKRAVYMKEASESMEMEEQVLYSELNKILIRKKRGETRRPATGVDPELVLQTDAVKQKPPINTNSLQERETIRLLINYGFNEIEEKYHLCDHYLEELEDIEFTTPVYNEILTIFRQKLKEGKIIDADYLKSHATENIKNEVLNLTSVKYELSENWEKRYRIHVPQEEEILKNSVYRNLLRLKYQKIKELIVRNLEELKSAKTEEEEVELQRINIELKNAESEFAGPLGRVIS